MGLDKTTNKSKISLGEIDENSFYDRFVEIGFYQKIPKENLTLRYLKSYQIFKKNQGSFAKIEPIPKSPSEIMKKRPINEEDVASLELKVSLMYSAGISLLEDFFPKADFSKKY